MDDETNPQFKPGALKEVFKLEQHRNTRVTDSGLALASEYLRLAAVEAIHRSVDTMKQEGGKAVAQSVQVKHLQTVSPGLLLDFQ